MEPIISPWVIYLFSVLTKLNIVASGVAIFSGASIIFIAFLLNLHSVMIWKFHLTIKL